MRHSSIQTLLYDYLHNELAENERLSVEHHLASCTRCANDLAALKRTLTLLPAPSSSPSTARHEAYWKSLSLAIEASLKEKDKVEPRPFADVFERLISFFTLRPGYAFALGTGLSIAIIAVVLFRLQPETPPAQTAQERSFTDSSIVFAQHETDQRVSRYFRKSKTLLVGLANLSEEDGNPDLRAEQKLSRKLVREARYLKHQPLDGRSAKLVADLEKILIELANLEEGNDLPNVELIRSGIKQENLLFKIRMAEEAFDTTNNNSIQKIF